MAFMFDKDDIEKAPQEMQDLHAYWQGLRGDRMAPTFKEFDLLRIPPHILPNSLVADYLADEDAFKYRFFGTEVATRHGEDMTGRSPLEFQWSPFGEAIENQYRGYLMRGVPEYLAFGFTNENGANELHKVLRLPLSDDGENVTSIVAILMASIDKDESRRFFENPEHHLGL